MWRIEAQTRRFSLAELSRATEERVNGGLRRGAPFDSLARFRRKSGFEKRTIDKKKQEEAKVSLRPQSSTLEIPELRKYPQFRGLK